MTAWFAHMPPEAKIGAQPDLYAGGGQAFRKTRSTRFAVTAAPVTAVVALVACTTVAHAQSAKRIEPTAQEGSASVADGETATGGLSELNAMTFSCPKAGLNAAAREAARVPSQGTYQFSYFRIISDSHHSSYEVHFKSNYLGEADLKYCVAIYCQQGWDPKNTQTSVRLIGDQRQPMGNAAHGADCSDRHAPVNKPAPVKR
jgi:hypothetical protein